MAISSQDRSLVSSLGIFFGLLVLAFGITFGIKRSATIDRGGSATSVKAETNATPTLPPNTSFRPSSQADKKVWLTSKKLTEGSVYTLAISDMDGGNKRQIYAITMPTGQSMTLPYNTWAPDDKHIFVEVAGSGKAPNYWVFQTSGVAFSDGQPYLDVGSFWIERKVPFTIRTATGWASETLLIIYTYKEDGSKGPNYWFDVPSKTFIQLSS